MRILRMRSTIARPADATAYAGGDEVSNHATAAVLRTLAAWTPTAVVNTIGITLDIEAE